MAHIRVEFTPTAFEYNHLYLVFDPDEVPLSGDEKTIRGGPVGFPSKIDVLVNIPLSTSPDAPGQNGNPPVAPFKVLPLGGRSAGDVWNLMVQHANNIDSAGLSYAPFIQNSNSTVASLLNAVGLSILDNIPGGRSTSDFPAVTNFLNNIPLFGTQLDATVNGTANDILVGGAGDDILSGGVGRDYYVFAVSMDQMIIQRSERC